MGTRQHGAPKQQLTIFQLIRKDLKRFRWVLTILGAVIWFVSNNYKEGQQEELKSLNEAIRESGSTFALRDDVESIRDRMHSQYEHDSEGYLTLNGELDLLDDSAKYADDTLRYVEPFISSTHVPINNDRISTLKNYSESIHKLSTVYRAKIDSPDGVNLGSLPVKKLPKSAEQIAEKIHSAVEQDGMKIRGLITDLKTDLEESSEKAAEQKRIEYENSKRLTKWLSVLGIVIGTIGQLVGVESREETT